MELKLQCLKITGVFHQNWVGRILDWGESEHWIRYQFLLPYSHRLHKVFIIFLPEPLNDNMQFIVFFLRKFSFHFAPVDMLDIQNFLLFHSTDIRPKEKELRDTLDAKIFWNANVFWVSGQSTMRCSEQRENRGGHLQEWREDGGGKFSFSDYIALNPWLTYQVSQTCQRLRLGDVS